MRYERTEYVDNYGSLYYTNPGSQTVWSSRNGQPCAADLDVYLQARNLKFLRHVGFVIEEEPEPW